MSMPDSWEYPWFAAWDLAFHSRAAGAHRPRLRQAAARACCCASGYDASQWPDPGLRMEFAFDDVNPPVHAWADLARLPHRPAPGHSGPRLPRTLFPEAVAQLHLRVNRAIRPDATSSPAASSAWTTSASSTAPARCRAAPSWPRLTVRLGWPATPRACSPSPSSWRGTIPPTRTSPEVLRALRPHRRRDQQPGRRWPVG